MDNWNAGGRVDTGGNGRVVGEVGVVMEIRSSQMTPFSDEVPPTSCSVCDKEFMPSDIFEFVCPECQLGLIGFCGCGSDDSSMDWGVNIEDDLPYYWIIDCCCGNEMKSRSHGLGEIGAVAKELYAAWTSRTEEREKVK